MAILHIIVLAVVQGLAELLPVSSSAHVIIVEKLLGLDPTTPEMTLLLVMLHTGTMFAVIAYFWKSWRQTFFASPQAVWKYGKLLVISTALTGVIALAIMKVVERVAFRNLPKAEIELLFGNLPLIAIALASVGILILYAALRQERAAAAQIESVGTKEAAWMGAIQGLCLPFRGFSRSGATISTGMILGASKQRVEEFSFAMAVVLTPPVLLREILRLLKSHEALLAHGGVFSLFLPELLGLVLSFAAGLLALRWLSRWLERGRWHFFGFYCLLASGVVLLLYVKGF